MSKRVQKTKTKELLPAEEREDSESDSSSLDKDLVLRLIEKMDKMNQKIEKIDGKFEKIDERLDKIERNNEAMDRYFQNYTQGTEARFQQEATKLEAMVDGKLGVFAAELSAELTLTREDLNKKLDDIVEDNQNMKRSVQEVGDRVTQIERTLKHQDSRKEDTSPYYFRLTTLLGFSSLL